MACKSKNGLSFQTYLRAAVEEKSYYGSKVPSQCTEQTC